MIWVLTLIVLASCQVPLSEKVVGETLEGLWNTIQRNHYIFRIPKKSMVHIPGQKYVNFFKKNQTLHEHKKNEVQRGELQALFYYEPQANNSQIYANYLFLRLYYPKYKNGRVIQMSIPIKQGWNSTTNSWNLKQNYIGATLYQNFEPIGKLDFEPSLTISENQNQKINITLKSGSINLQIWVGKPNYGYKHFFIFLTINLVQLSLIVCYYQMRNRNILFNTSQWLIVHGTCFLFMEALLYLLIAFNFYNTPLKFLLINTVLNIVVMLLLLRKFEAVIEKFKNIYNLVASIIFILAYLILASNYYESQGFWVIESMIFIWQISHSMTHGNSGGASLDLILIILLSRIPLWHLLGSEDNILRLQPSYSILLLIMANTLLHLFIIGIQYKYGGRFMIPNKFIPGFHNYFKSAQYEAEEVKNECPICLNELRKKPQDMTESQPEQSSSDVSQQNLNAKVWYASAPCKHTFHPKCLGDWMKERLVCPVCRNQLPPLNAKK